MYSMLLHYQLFVCVVCTLLGLVSCRGGSPEPDDSGVYLPAPREPRNKTSRYVQDAPISPITDDVYNDVSGYYMGFYPRYSQHAGKPGVRNLTEFSVDDHLCLNFHADDNGFYLGYFTCPQPFVPKEFTGCCGADYAEFCCLTKSRLDENVRERNMGILALCCIVIGVIIGGVIFFLGVRYGSVLINMMQRKGAQEHEK